MSSQVITADNAKIVIQINPQVAEGQDKSKTYDNTPLKRFLKVQPKSLGIVQIMIGVVTFLVGIVLTTEFRYSIIPVSGGITYWGSLIYIIAGSLSVAAENKPNPCLVLAHGIVAVMLVFSILQFIISICICKTCSCDANPLVISNTIDLMVLEKEASPLNMPQPPRRN
ncbi:membrane-spanning 4-domains subfamily A member 15-like [Paramisgurnus dabryanus]|uniref:membrane-spanning 4-domains subfamily A member 15-like n=1 Tax=Paramisgurnus dabryanus TaxID=90735 RepID=UPI0031F468B7